MVKNINELGIILVEIKCKYKDYLGNFGINQMQYEFISKMQNYGIRAFNVILEKNKGEDALQFCLKNDKKIIFSRIPLGNDNKKTAPKKTSYKGNREQKYHSISGKKYKEFNFNGNFINLICYKCNNKLIERKGKYGQMLDCSKFKDDNCRVIIGLE